MLGSFNVFPLISTTQPEAAKAFYGDVLGLTLLHEDPFGMSFAAGLGSLRLSRVEAMTAQPFSILGWRVPDIEPALDGLATRGVEFLRYPFLEQDARGIWSTPDGLARLAWFHDPDNNVLSLVHAPEER